MKTTGKCPKCESKQLVRIPGGPTNQIATGPTVFHTHISLTRYICSQCGFSEDWIDSAADLATAVEKFGVTKHK